LLHRPTPPQTPPPFPYTTLFRSTPAIPVADTPQIQQDRAQLRELELSIAQKTKEQEDLQHQIRVLQGRIELSPTIQQEFKALTQDRKSTRLNSSHRTISYAVFCL